MPRKPHRVCFPVRSPRSPPRRGNPYVAFKIVGWPGRSTASRHSTRSNVVYIRCDVSSHPCNQRACAHILKSPQKSLLIELSLSPSPSRRCHRPSTVALDASHVIAVVVVVSASSSCEADLSPFLSLGKQQSGWLERAESGSAVWQRIKQLELSGAVEWHR